MARKKNPDIPSLYKRKNGIYYARQWDEFVKAYTPAKSTGESEYDAAYRKALEMMKNGQFAKRENDPFFLEELLRYWESRQGLKPSYHERMLWLARGGIAEYKEFHGLRLSKLKPYHINRFIDYLRHEGKSGESVKLRIVCIKSFLNWAYSRGYTSEKVTDRIERIKTKARRRGALTFDEMLALSRLDWPDHRMKTAVMLGCFAGLRKGEIRALQWQDVDFETNFLYIRRNFTDQTDEQGKPVYLEPKSGESREYPYMAFPQLKNALLRQWQETPFREPYHPVLPHVQNDIVKPLPHHTIMPAFRKMLQSIGISIEEQQRRFLTFHSLRHSYVSMMDATGSQKTTMSLSGHATRDMLENYSHASSKAVADHINTAVKFLQEYSSEENENLH